MINVFDAAAAGNLQRVRGLVEQNAGLVHANDPGGWTPLLIAAFYGHVEVVRCLHDHGGDVICRDPDNMCTPLHWACLRGNSAMVMLLLRNGAETDAVAFDGLTPMHMACVDGQAAVLVHLLEAGVDPSVRDDDARTPLDYATHSHHQACISILQEYDRAYVLQRARRLRDAAATSTADADEQGL